MRDYKPIVTIEGNDYKRIAIKTKVFSADDNIIDLIKEFVLPHYQDGDIISISESPVAITQGRAIPTATLKIGFLANFLWKFVAKVPYGVGLRAPASMQCAIDECGAPRILFAALVSGLGKIFRIKGIFYIIAGKQAALIDAATTSPIPPYNECVIKGPKNPEKVTANIKNILGCEAVIMDINDIGGSWAIGASRGVNKKLVQKIMIDNPQGQGDELTPFCIIRKV